MDEELQKRNTDCVYFLASPLTCKKGIECEYRHSEIARLNPRDCWYWLAGNCINPTCAFRHPPLEGHTSTVSEPASLHYQSIAPVNKTNVPCYFYFNGFCNKGDRCSFLHGPDDGAPVWKAVKAASSVTNAPPLDKKTPVGSDTGSALPETYPKSSETGPRNAADMQGKPREDILQAASKDIVEQNASPHISASEFEEATAVNSVSSLPLEDFVEDRSLVRTDQSSEEQLDGHVEREEWLESSPGFDVLVDDRSENLGYGDDPGYLLRFDSEGRELDSQFLPYEYEDHLEHDAEYQGARYSEKEMHDSYDHLDNEHAYDYVKEVPEHRETISDRIFPRKRKLLPMNQGYNGQGSVDLRDHLQKRRVIDGHSSGSFSRRHDSFHLVGRSRERSQRQGTRRLHGRLASKVETNIVGSRTRNKTMTNGASPWCRSRHSRIDRSRQQSGERRLFKQQFLSSEISRRADSTSRRSTGESTVFSGPKSLAQIKEEKQKTQENGAFGKLGMSAGTVPEDFQGPRPLSEILKEKRRLGSVVESNNLGR